MEDIMSFDDSYWQETGKTLDELALELFNGVKPSRGPTDWENYDVVFKVGYQELIENHDASYNSEKQAIKDWLLNFINKRREKLIALNSSETMTEQQFWDKYFTTYGELDLYFNETDDGWFDNDYPNLNIKPNEYYYSLQYEPEWFPDPSEGFLDPVAFLLNEDDVFNYRTPIPGKYQLNMFLFNLEFESILGTRVDYFAKNEGRTMTELEFFNIYFDPFDIYDWVKYELTHTEYPIPPYVNNDF